MPWNVQGLKANDKAHPPGFTGLCAATGYFISWIGETMYLKFLKTVRGCYGVEFPVGKIKQYYPWDSVWQGMTEPERVAKGIFVECHGMGEFDVFRDGDVEVVK